MSEYTQQADDFLNKHGLKFRAVYKETAPYFDGEKESRDIYTLTVSSKGRGRFSVKFGASLVMTRDNTQPTAYDLLSCLQKYDPETFEDFCSEFGYSTDSRKAEKMYRAVSREWRKVSAFFTPEELDELREIN